MIQSLYIKNFILIDSLHLDFESGFSAFTGETGAGKSIAMDAIGLLCGDRVNSNMIRTGSDKAVIEGVESLSGANCKCTDLRGGAALVTAALASKGETQIGDICHILRGYEDIVSNLSSLGADIKIV